MSGSNRRPDLQSILGKLHRKESVTEEELRQLHHQIAELEAHAARGRHQEPCEFDAVAAGEPFDLMRGHGTGPSAAGSGLEFGRNSAAGFYRTAQDVLISSIGIGTYRGPMTSEADAAYAEAIHAALEAGVNLIDTSLNYRRQRSERAVGRGIRLFLEKSGAGRDQLLVCTKGGYVLAEAVTAGTLGAEDVVGGVHSMAPAFLADQIDRSRRNMGLHTIDVYYIHNPETQLKFVGMPAFMNRVRAAFERLERAVSDGVVRYFGTATWSGFRNATLSLRSLAAAAREVAGKGHHFRFVQLPFNLEMQEARTRPADDGRTVLDLAAELGITVVASASLSRARLSCDLPDEIAQEMPGLVTDAQRAIQFARSTPGIACTLVGMRSAAHVAENLALAGVRPLTPVQYEDFCSATSSVLSERPR